MNSLWVVVIGGVVIVLAYNFYAKQIDRRIIQADRQRPTPVRMYMDGVDFVPTSRFILYGYHFKSIAAAGPIVGVITAANLWGWLPSILWLMAGVSLIGWASDYSAIMVAVRSDGNSLSAIAHRLIAPRTRRILFVFIFFYLLLIGGAFVGIMAAILAARPDVPFGILVLAVAGLLAGILIYKRRADLIRVTLGVVLVTLVAMAIGPLGVNLDLETGEVPDWSEGPISGAVLNLNDAVNGEEPLYTVVDPTFADPRRGDRTELGVPELPVVGGVPARVQLPGGELGHLAVRPASELHRLLDHRPHHRDLGHRGRPGGVPLPGGGRVQ